MTTLALLTQATWDLLYGVGGFERPWEDVAAGVVSTGATNLNALVTVPASWREGDMMEFPVGELVSVTVDTATTVIRARDGTTAEALVAGDVIIKDPIFPRKRVVQAINEVVRGALWPTVWSWHQDTLTFLTADHMYDLDLYVEDVDLVYQENLNADERWYPLPRQWWSVERQLNTAVATNNAMLRVKHVHDSEETVYYTARRRPHLSDLANMSDEIADMVPYGAAGKLAVARSIQQKAHRTSEQRPKAFINDYEGFMTEFHRMRKNLADQLRLDVRPEREFVPQRRRAW